MSDDDDKRYLQIMIGDRPEWVQVEKRNFEEQKKMSDLKFTGVLRVNGILLGVARIGADQIKIQDYRADLLNLKEFRDFPFNGTDANDRYIFIPIREDEKSLFQSYYHYEIQNLEPTITCYQKTLQSVFHQNSQLIRYGADFKENRQTFCKQNGDNFILFQITKTKISVPPNLEHWISEIKPGTLHVKQDGLDFEITPDFVAKDVVIDEKNHNDFEPIEYSDDDFEVKGSNDENDSDTVGIDKATNDLGLGFGNIENDADTVGIDDKATNDLGDASGNIEGVGEIQQAESVAGEKDTVNSDALRKSDQGLQEDKLKNSVINPLPSTASAGPTVPPEKKSEATQYYKKKIKELFEDPKKAFANFTIEDKYNDSIKNLLTKDFLYTNLKQALDNVYSKGEKPDLDQVKSNYEDESHILELYRIKLHGIPINICGAEYNFSSVIVGNLNHDEGPFFFKDEYNPVFRSVYVPYLCLKSVFLRAIIDYIFDEDKEIPLITTLVKLTAFYMLLGDTCINALAKANKFTTNRTLPNKNILIKDEYYNHISSFILLFGCTQQVGDQKIAIENVLNASQLSSDDDSDEASAGGNESESETVEVISPSNPSFKSEAQAEFFTTAAMVLDNSKWNKNPGVNTIIERVYKILTEKRQLSKLDKTTVSTGILQLLLLASATHNINDENFFQLLEEKAQQMLDNPSKGKSVRFVNNLPPYPEDLGRKGGTPFEV